MIRTGKFTEQELSKIWRIKEILLKDAVRSPSTVSLLIFSRFITTGSWTIQHWIPAKIIPSQNLRGMSVWLLSYMSRAPLSNRISVTQNIKRTNIVASLLKEKNVSATMHLRELSTSSVEMLSTRDPDPYHTIILSRHSKNDYVRRIPKYGQGNFETNLGSRCRWWDKEKVF